MALPTPTIRTGQLATGGTNAVLPNQLVIDMDERVYEYDPPGSPGMAIISKRGNVKAAEATKVEWMEDQPVPYWDTNAATFTNVATQIQVTNPTYWSVGNLLKVVSTDEVVRVIGVDTTTSLLTVTRAYMGTATAVNTTGAFLLNLSTAEMEGDASPEAKSTVKAARFNYVQIQKTPVHISNTAQAVRHYSGDERARQQRKAGEAHARRWEEICMHGRKKEDTASAFAPIRACGGLDEHITSNVLAAGGALTESEFIPWIGDSFRFSVSPGRSSKFLYASRAVIASINSWGLGKLVMNDKASATYGMDIKTYVSGFGTLQVINHPLLEQGYSGIAYLVDPDGIIYRPLRRTQLHVNIQDPGEDAVKDEYRTEASFQFALEMAFGKVSGVTF